MNASLDAAPGVRALRDQQPKIELCVEVRHDGWRNAIEDVDGFANVLVSTVIGVMTREALLTQSMTASPIECSIVFAEDAFVQKLNAEYRGKNSPTNVLSFPAKTPSLPPGAPRQLGDVVLAYETTCREAESQGKTTSDHVSHLLVHGLLHLLGYDHVEEEEAVFMERLETGVLAELGIADPYRSR